MAISASAHAALRCVTACREDFRADLATISVPVLVIHGDQDRVLPFGATGSRLPALLSNARSVVIAGGPHAIIWTHADEVNQVLLDFTRAGLAHGTADRRKCRADRSTGRPADPGCDRLLERLEQPDPEQSAWLRKVAGGGEVTGSLERATTDRSDKRTFCRTASGFSCR